jgi:hypothetical protein
MEPPHSPTETLAPSCARTAGKWFSPVPRITQMKPQARAISPIRAENPQRLDSLAERAEFELSVPWLRASMVMQFGRRSGGKLSSPQGCVAAETERRGPTMGSAAPLVFNKKSLSELAQSPPSLAQMWALRIGVSAAIPEGGVPGTTVCSTVASCFPDGPPM